MARKECLPTQLRNPATGRCVSKTGVLGKALAAAAAAPATKECRRPCASDKVCNPATGNCVLKRGTIGKRLVGEKKGVRFATGTKTVNGEYRRGPHGKKAWSPGTVVEPKIVNASDRGTHTVPKGRKAPAGHAKQFPDAMATGLDGHVWVSTWIAKSKTYRWKRA